jgi:hypothetical protein
MFVVKIETCKGELASAVQDTPSDGLKVVVCGAGKQPDVLQTNR